MRNSPWSSFGGARGGFSPETGLSIGGFRVDFAGGGERVGRSMDKRRVGRERGVDGGRNPLPAGGRGGKGYGRTSRVVRRFLGGGGGVGESGR